ncbi:MAG: LysR family transcriptional regulator [Thermodesulfobacteriota bacterium]|nr:LysR family transcriptional regulator [Thermodesulfobacteriota bacterium]
MNFDQLKTFHHVARAGSFTLAARELFLTQPAVSQQIKALEFFLGITLFDRSGKQVRLTSEGEVLLSYTDRLFHLYDEIETIFSRMQELKKGKITIGSTAVIGTYFLPRIIGQYNKKYPGIKIDLKVGNSNTVHSMLNDSKVDLGFAGKIKTHAGFEGTLIHRERFLMVVSPEHTIAAKRSVSADDLIKIPFIWREKGTQTRELVSQWFVKKGGRNYPSNSIELHNIEAAKRMVVEGYGITVVPEISVRREMHLGLLKSIDLKGFDLTFDYYLFYLKGKILSRAAEAFLATAADEKLLSHAAGLKKQMQTARVK